ncbi:hypothetical protein [Azohydromonas aeria]|uniref:hypothetical protein n=1 Tax=Azohydromonas aeria TaxID=2590212 RepID=UPI001E502A48|nr:hypothetical protein [Azohydromonas aeria]
MKNARLIMIVAAAAALCGLAACGESPQEVGVKHVKSDKPAHSGAQAAYSAPGWNAGDRASWEQQIRTRGQGQNEYARSPAAAPQQ